MVYWGLRPGILDQKGAKVGLRIWPKLSPSPLSDALHGHCGVHNLGIKTKLSSPSQPL
jgi:hypothetical protein